MLAFVAVLAVGCKKKSSDPSTKESSSQGAGASMVELFERGSVAWNVESSGQVLAHIHHNDDGDITEKSKGTIEWTENGETKSAALKFDSDRQALVAQGPALEADLTEIRYTLVTNDEPVSGALHVPAEGSESLMASVNASAKVSVEGVAAPHGGVVQVVGEERIEIVGDDDSDEVRVYVYDASWKPIVVGGRKITVAIGGSKPEVVVLAPGPDLYYCVGTWHVVGEPPRVTVVIKNGGKTHVAIVGYKPGIKMKVAGGPKVHVKVKGKGFGPGVKVNGGGPAMVKIDIKDKGPKGKVKIKFK